MPSKDAARQKSRKAVEHADSGEKACGPLKVGLTGNIGTGKSTAAAIFRELGVPTFDTDKIGHELLETDLNVQRKVVESFGNKIIDGGLISRHKLGQVVFSNENKRRELEAILHPVIMSAVDRQIRQADNQRYSIVEVPLLYEAQLSDQFDYVILVKAEREISVERASTKLGLSSEEIEKRLDAQIPQSEKEKLADFVITNDGTQEDLKLKVRLLHTIISSLNREADPDI